MSEKVTRLMSGPGPATAFVTDDAPTCYRVSVGPHVYNVPQPNWPVGWAEMTLDTGPLMGRTIRFEVYRLNGELRVVDDRDRTFILTPTLHDRITGMFKTWVETLPGVF